jgi:hypothetical protein
MIKHENDRGSFDRKSVDRNCVFSVNLQPKKEFDQLTKNQFDQTPKLLENFDQLKMSSEIRSSDRFPMKTTFA